MRRRAWGWVVVTVIASATGWLALQRADMATRAPAVAPRADATALAPDRAAPAPAAGPGGAAADGGRPRAPAPAAAAAPTGDALPLPPLETPLATVLDDLERRARAGDVGAACRLASDLSRCARLPRRRAVQEGTLSVPPDLDARSTERLIDAAASFEIALEADERFCADVPRERTRSGLQWLLAAARGGNRAAMTAFASGSWTADGAVLHQPDVLSAYLREGEAMARTAIEAGSAQLIYPLAFAYAGDARVPTPLAEVVEPNPVLARALLALVIDPPRSRAAPAGPGVESHAGGPDPHAMARRLLAALDAQLDPAQRTAADAESARLRARIETSPPQDQAPPPPRLWSIGYIDAEACER